MCVVCGLLALCVDGCVLRAVCWLLLVAARCGLLFVVGVWCLLCVVAVCWLLLVAARCALLFAVCCCVLLASLHWLLWIADCCAALGVRVGCCMVFDGVRCLCIARVVVCCTLKLLIVVRRC